MNPKNAPLKVMQLVLSLAIGGTEKLVYDIAHRVEKHAVSPVICCLDEFGHFGEELQKEGYPVHALERKPGLDWDVVKKLKTVIREEHIDVIHAHQYTPYFYGIMAVLLCKLSPGVPAPKLIFTEHGRFYPDQRKLKRVIVNPIFSLFTDEIVSISECTKRALIEYENFPARKIHVVYNGIDPGVFSEESDPLEKKISLGLDPESPIVGIVARLDPIKNHAMLLKAFKLVLQQSPAAYLLIVGDGPEREALTRLSDSLEISGRVVFLGARRDVAELLHIFDVFALSSFSEGTSVTLLEAMGAGLPIVATRVGGNPEVISDGETGYLVENDSERDMAEKLLVMLRDSLLRTTLGEAGRKRIHTLFTLDRMVHSYTNLYVDVCKYTRHS